MQAFIRIDKLNFTYNNSIKPLFESLSFQLQQGWTGIVGANGSGKTTLLKLLTGSLQPDEGFVQFSGLSYYCEQRTDEPPANLDNLIHSTGNEAFRLKNMLRIKEDWLYHWQQLSHGERKRCQIGAALFYCPDLLAVDEPSNHLDPYSKTILFKSLQKYAGIGLLVSHDRFLLDNLCTHTLFTDPPEINLYQCNYSTAVKEKNRTARTNKKKYDTARQEEKKLKKKMIRQRAKADHADKARSKRNIAHKDHDAKSKKDLARLTGKDAVAGQQYKRMQTQMDRIRREKKSVKISKEFDLGIDFNPQASKRFFPVIIHTGKIQLGDDKQLTFPELAIPFQTKIGLIGNNGSGKSTFIRHLIKILNADEEQIIYIPQEISTAESSRMIKRIRQHDNKQKGRLMTVIRRLGSDPEHILETDLPSPGEVRKIMLAEGISKGPAIIVMDEPTNHMDLPSIECVESALKNCECTQLLVSHDQAFLNQIIDELWIFETVSEKEYQIKIQS